MGKKSKSEKGKQPTWKTVKLDEGLLARGIPQELVGIEVLRDYKLIKRKSRDVKSFELAKDIPKAIGDPESRKLVNLVDKNGIIEKANEKKPKVVKKKKPKQKKSSDMEKRLKEIDCHAEEVGDDDDDVHNLVSEVCKLISMLLNLN